VANNGSQDSPNQSSLTEKRPQFSNARQPHPGVIAWLGRKCPFRWRTYSTNIGGPQTNAPTAPMKKFDPFLQEFTRI
jgi:hypothetical protein